MRIQGSCSSQVRMKEDLREDEQVPGVDTAGVVNYGDSVPEELGAAREEATCWAELQTLPQHG